MKDTQARKILETVYKRLSLVFGSQNWWSTRTAWERVVSVILIKNSNWLNVEKAINNLKRKNLLIPLGLKKIPVSQLTSLIQPCSYFKQKAKIIKNFLDFVFQNYEGSLNKMFKEDYLVLRAKLLGINSIGLETVDSILLYAADKPVFVVDAYTKKILSRHNLISHNFTYNQTQNYLMDNLPEDDIELFKEFHALLVRLGKEICKYRPDCQECALKDIDKLILYTCDSCGKQLPKLQDRYVLKIELYAWPEIEITRQDLEKDPQQEIKRLLKDLKGKKREELEEEVYVCYKLNLCKNCRDIFNNRIKHREFV